MSDRVKLPANTEAMRKADDEFYEHHPELVQDGDPTPINANDPAQAELVKEWMALYVANGGELESTPPVKKKPADHTHPCPTCSDTQGHLIVNVVDNFGQPIPDASVTADGMQKKTDQQGVADFGVVDAKTYNIAASKDKYYDFFLAGYPDTATVEPQETTTATLALARCLTYDLAHRYKISQAAQNFATVPKATITIPDSAGGPVDLEFFDDITFGYDQPLPSGDSVGNTELTLRDKMAALLILFAKNQTDHFPYRCFGKFFEPNSSVIIWSDPMLDKTIENSVNFDAFAQRVLGAPGTKGAHPQEDRIHQWLQYAGWDINHEVIINVKTLAFNDGSLQDFSGDYGNGLTILINSVQQVLVFVDAYHYDSCKQQYTITLIFELYDVFGLDDDDLKKYGTAADGVPLKAKAAAFFSEDAAVTLKTLEEGFTAWWQLQHQFNYAPMVIKSVVTKTYTVSTIAE